MVCECLVAYGDAAETLLLLEKILSKEMVEIYEQCRCELKHPIPTKKQYSFRDFERMDYCTYSWKSRCRNKELWAQFHEMHKTWKLVASRSAQKA